MKKVILGILGVVVLGVGGVAVAASMQPDDIHVERSITIAASAADVAPFAEDLQKVNEWSPWEKLDPNVDKKYSEETNVVGSTYEWKGNEDVGHGLQTIKSIEPGKVVHELEFFEPFPGKADATIAYAVDGDGVKVTWSLDQKADFPLKVMTTFSSMDDMLGPQFDEGLGMLKPLAETAAKERIAAEKKAEDEATAKVMAEAEAAKEAEAAEAAEGGAAEGEGEGEPTEVAAK